MQGLNRIVSQSIPTALALVVGVFIGGWFFGDDPVAPAGADAGFAQWDITPRAGAPDTGALPREVADAAAPSPRALVEVVEALDEEQRRREALSQQVAALEERLATLVTRVEALGTGDPEALSKAAFEQAIADLDATPLDAGERELQRFIDAGFSQARAESLKAREDRIALDRLFLRDQARREGWLGTQRYREEMEAVNGSIESLRAELGDEDFDRFLYATGRPNRIVVRDTLTSGPADQAGLQPGDAIVSYDGRRVFDTRSLIGMTQDGDFGAPTAVEVERAGERLVLYVPRGPLGVNMRSSVRKPPQ